MALPQSPGNVVPVTEVAGTELVGLAPRAAFEGFPEQVPLRGYATIEDSLHRRAATS